jgi:hypothetical protein
MRLDPAILAQLTVRIDPTDYVRVIHRDHRATPTGMGYGATRFASPSNAFQLLYVAESLETGIAERIVRDRFQGRNRRAMAVEELDDYAVANMAARAPLDLIDLRTSGAMRLGISTNTARAKTQREGRKFSEALYAQTDVDGIVYFSRITGEECLAVYDRAVMAKFDARCRVADLNALIELEPALRALNILLIGRT